MSWRDRWWLRRYGMRRTLLDREATPADLADLRAFVGAHEGVELYVEPETAATDTTAVAVDRHCEWRRRRVGSPEVARRLAAELRVPAYDVQVVGYPQRMRDWNRAHRAQRGGAASPG